MAEIKMSAPARLVNRLPMIAAAALLGVSLAACQTTPASYRNEIVGAIPDDYRINHPIVVGEQLATFDIPVGMNTRNLAPAMNANIAGFGAEFMRSGATSLAIVLPSGSGNAAVAARIGAQIEEVLVASGVPRIAIEYRSYAAQPTETSAAIRLAFSRIAAGTAPCGPWPDNVAQDNTNSHYYNYGCASQQNLAAIVANPLDLLYPRAMTPADASRRSQVLGNYQSGMPTETAYDSNFGTQIGNVGQ